MEYLDLQLFSDGGEETGATAEDSGSDGAVEKVALDENGDVRIFYEEGETEPEGAEVGTRDDEDEQVYYAPEEVRATDFEKLDPARIPQELLPWYKSMQAGFTRKTQELAQQKRAVQEMLEQARGGTPAMDQESPQGYVQGMVSAAQDQVERLFNQEYDEFNPAHAAAMTLLQQLYADANQAAGRREVLGGLESELRSQDGNYDEIYDFARAKATELPYRDYVRLQEAFSRGDAGVLRSYYEAARRHYYAEKQGVRTGEKRGQAPRLEGAGNGAAVGKEPPNFAELGRLKSFDDKLVWLRRHNIKP